VLQLNVGDRCNLRCTHCLASSGPEGRRVAPRALLADALAVLERHPTIEVVDVTGGSPELVPDLPWFLDGLAGRPQRLLFRTNLAALEGPAWDIFVPRLQRLRAEVIASLPGLSADVVDAQRGAGTFARAIPVLRRLNAAGFGTGAPGGGRLAIAWNPAGPELPPPQAQVEAELRAGLARDHGVRFDALYALANVPLGRFRAQLAATGALAGYEALLRARHDPATLAAVMCRDTLTADADGALFDCEFNRAAGLALRSPEVRTLADLRTRDWPETPVAWGAHCFACTAGAGSS
jgi:radical SAM/Cys-rich protein